MNVARVIKLRDGESVSAVIRNHWLVHAGNFLLSFLLIALPFFLMVPLFRFGWLGMAVFVSMALAGLIVGWRTAFVWYWNAFIITSDRVIDIDQRGFFERVVSEASYDKVQDVSYKVKGIMGTILNVGSVTVQTAGTNSDLELNDVHEPQEAQHLITRKMEAYRGDQSRGERAQGLVAAAAEMTDAEARAFVTELQVAMAQEREAAAKKPPVAGPKAAALPDDWRNPKDETEDGPEGWRRRHV
jgi:membrane protein YdbS with pleckstrin-like domain